VDDQQLRAVLDAERARAEQRLAAARADFDRIVAAGELVATDDEHDPEGIGLAMERAHVSAAVESALQRLEQLDAAQTRLTSDDFGRCTVCGRPIPIERLLIRPTALTCVGCAPSTR